MPDHYARFKSQAIDDTTTTSNGNPHMLPAKELTAMRRRATAILGKIPRVRSTLKRLWYVKRYLLRRHEGVQALRDTYSRVHGRTLDLENPTRFTEKLFCRMIQWHWQGCGNLTNLADKLLVRSYVAETIGEQYLTQVYWHGKDPSVIPFDRLAERYVLKTNHGSAHVIKVVGSVDRAEVAATLRQWLSTNHYWKEREYQYLEICPEVLAEEYLDDGYESGPLDYRFWCFGGTPHLIQVDNFRHDINPFYDRNWQPLQLSYRKNCTPVEIPKPPNLDEMVAVASSLSAEFDFVRVDLYNIHGRIVFGELTFTPLAGFLKFNPDSWDADLGRRWPELP